MPYQSILKVIMLARGKTFCGIIMVFLLFGTLAQAKIVIKDKEFKDARKECAMCHYYWMETFLSGEGTELVPHPKERHAVKERMCSLALCGGVLRAVIGAGGGD